ncbi:hypothetical protein AaE_002292, partial [Aphanomyces astaci]
QIVTIPASTKHSMVTVQVVNKVHLRDIPLGYMTLPLSTLFASSTVESTSSRGGCSLLTLPPPTATSRFTVQVAPRRPSRWVRPQFTNDVKEKRHIAFALGDFLNQPFVWHSFGARLMRLSDHFLARHFIVQALRRLPPPHDLRAIHMMLDVARCDLACRGNAANATKQQSSSVASAIEWLQKAHVAALMLEPRHPHVENAILDVMQQAMMHDSPFERKLTASLTQPLAADYVAVVSEHGQYFVNKDTGDCVLDEPLGYEVQAQKPPLRHHIYGHLMWLQRMVVFNDSMKQRVLRLRRDMKDAAAADPDQWVAMFDDFHGRMFFVSQVHSMQSYTTPPKYIMQGDEMTVYSVLVIQDVFRARRRKAALRSRFRRAVWAVGVGLYMLEKWKARVIARAIRAAKVPLTCIRVTVHRADGLRTADRVSSDPFVQLSLPGCKSRRTAIRKATLTPEWDEVFHMRRSSPLAITDTTTTTTMWDMVS